MSVITRRGSNTEFAVVNAWGQCDPCTVGEHANIGLALDRREFIGTVGVTAVVALVPTVTPTLTTTGPATSGAAPQLLDDWSIDDMFGVWPRYADPIPPGNSWPDDTDSGEPLNAL